MSGVLFYTIPIGLSVGIFCSSLFAVPKETALLGLLLSFALSVLWRRRNGNAASPLIAGSLLLLAASIGLLRFEMTTWKVPQLAQFEHTEVALEGVVMREPDVRESSQHLYIEEKSSGELFLATTDTFMPVSYGDVVIVEGLLQKPEAFETDLGRTFNYEGYLKAKGVTYAMFFADVSVTDKNRGHMLIAELIAAKHAFMDALEVAIPEPQAGLAEGLLLGAKRALGADLEDAFRTTGIIHIIVLSGFNLMVVAEAVMRLLSFFFRPFVRMCIGIAVIALFAVAVGLSATVVRASLMAGLVLFARATGRSGNALRALAVAGVAMLLMNPHLLVFDPGFQLSFLATLGLILVSPHLERLFNFTPSRFDLEGGIGKFREYVTATIATQLMVLPLLLYLMGQFSLVAVLVNVLVLPMVPVTMFLAFLTGVSGLLFAPLGLLVGFMANMALVYIILTATLFAELPFASFAVPPFPFAIVVLLYAALALLIALMHTRRERTAEKDQEELAEWEIVSLETITHSQNEPGKTQHVLPGSFPFR